MDGKEVMGTFSTLPTKLQELSRGLVLVAPAPSEITEQQRVPYEYKVPVWWTVVSRIWMMSIWSWWCPIAQAAFISAKTLDRYMREASVTP